MTQYWCSERLVVAVDGPSGHSVVSLDQPLARVGSHPSADVVLAGPTVAPRSLYLHATAEGVYCLFLDMPAAEGLDKGRWLAPDEKVALGEYSLQASLGTGAVLAVQPAANLAASGSASPPLPVMLVYCGDLLKDKRRFRTKLSLVGRRPQCGLRLKGQKVSSFHCVLYWDGGKLWCIDLKSSNGTTLNGQPVECAEIRLGDRLDVGEFGLVFQRLSQGGGQTRERASSSSAGDTQQSQLAGTEPTPTRSTDHPAVEQPVSGEDSPLRELLAAEVSRLGSQQDAMQARWAAMNEQLTRQIAALQEEAAQLALERQALAAARSEFLEEQSARKQELADRSIHLALYEEKLALAAEALSTRLDQPPASDPVDTERDENSPRLEVQIEKLQNELAELAGQRVALEQLRQDWQAERLALTQQLAARDEQLARLESDLVAMTAEWKRRLDDADDGQGSQSRRTSETTAGNRAIRHNSDSIDPSALEPIDEIVPEAAAHFAADAAHRAGGDGGTNQPVAENVAPVAPIELRPGPELNEAEELSALDFTTPLPDAKLPRVAGDEAGASVQQTIRIQTPDKVRPRDQATDETEQLSLLISSRVGEKYAASARRWLWWSAGGIAVAILLVTIVVGVMWVF